jgi:diguanylate cyclase (GGDEF)-like protein/putative nucleotidyltransferase with HDIG domain
MTFCGSSGTYASPLRTDSLQLVQRTSENSRARTSRSGSDAEFEFAPGLRARRAGQPERIVTDGVELVSTELSETTGQIVASRAAERPTGMLRPPSRERLLQWGPLFLLGCVLVQVALVLTGSDEGAGRAVAQVLFVGTIGGAAAISTIAATGPQPRRVWVGRVLIAAALGLWTLTEIGGVFIAPVPAGELGSPVLDGMWFVTFFLAVAALVVFAWATVGGPRSTVWLDVASVALAAAAAAAVALPWLTAAGESGSAVLSGTASGQVGVLGITVGLVALGGLQGQVRWAIVGAAVAAVATANAIELDRIGQSHADPTLAHTLWGLAALGIAVFAILPATRRVDELPTGAILAPASAGIASIALLILGYGRDIDFAVVVLAALALAAVVLRMTITFVNNRRLVGALSRRESEQAALRRVATAVAADAEPGEVFSLVARQVAGLLDSEVGLVCRFDAGEASIVGSVGVGVDGNGAGRPLRRDGALARMVQSGETARIDDFSRLEDDEWMGSEPMTVGLRRAVAAPIDVRGNIWGAVVAARRRNQALPDDAEARLQNLAQLVGMAIDNAEARARLVERADTDSLTGLANHRSFQEGLHREFERSTAEGRPLALVLFDLDHFKRVNDAHGHQIGDQVLVEVAQCLRRSARMADIAARVGGEEFAWILTDTDGEAAVAAAERVRREVASLPVSMPSGVSLTISAGACDLENAASAEELVELADGALYWAKAQGRDATYLYSPSVVKELSAQERAARLERQQALAGLRALARAVDAKDHSTQEHSLRVADIAVQISGELGWSDRDQAMLHEAGLLHDVGKIGVPDAVLFKEGALTEPEFELIKQHSALGAEIADEVLGADQVAWIRGHHERWDGGGYPERLQGDDITEGARILALADAWDVMLTVRTYKQALSEEEAIAEVHRVNGTQFAPDVVAAFMRLSDAGRVPARAPAATLGSRAVTRARDLAGTAGA